MNLDRIIEVLSPYQEIDVHFHGIPMWIESVGMTSSRAVVSEPGTHCERQIVSIDALKETGKY